MTGIEIVPYRPELKDAVIELWRDVFEGDASARREYMEWKYEQNPYLPDPLLFVALDRRGRVVGTRGFAGARWETPTGDELIPCAEDFVIAREHRGSGLAAALMRYALESMTQRGFAYVMNATGGQITVLQSLAMGWKSVGAMEPVARLSRPARLDVALRGVPGHARRFLRAEHVTHRLRRTRSDKGRGGRMSLFARRDRAGRQPVGSNGAEIVVEHSPRSDAMKELVARMTSDGRIRHARDRVFFEWRYRNPTRAYRFLFYDQDGRTDGFLVVVRDPFTGFSLTDWEGLTTEIRAELLEYLLTWGGRASLGTWTASLPNETRALLARTGFAPVQLDLRARGMPCVLLRKLSDDGDWSIAGIDALESSNWDIRLIDTMHG